MSGEQVQGSSSYRQPFSPGTISTARRCRVTPVPGCVCVCDAVVPRQLPQSAKPMVSVLWVKKCSVCPGPRAWGGLGGWRDSRMEGVVLGRAV